MSDHHERDEGKTLFYQGHTPRWLEVRAKRMFELGLAEEVGGVLRPLPPHETLESALKAYEDFLEVEARLNPQKAIEDNWARFVVKKIGPGIP